MAHMPASGGGGGGGGGGGSSDGIDIYDVTAYGADNTGLASATTAITNAIAAAAARTLVTGRYAVVYFPGGEYLVNDKLAIRQFDIANMHRISFVGTPGNRSKIRMTGSAGLGDWYLFQIRSGSTEIEFRDLVMTQVSITNPDPNEQNHLIQIGSQCEKIKIINCTMTTVVGDCIRFLGDFGTEVKDVDIDGCTFYCARSGVSFQRWTRNVRLVNFRMFGGTDQQIDFEPTGYGLQADAGGSATSLIDASASFITWGIEVGDLIVNTTDSVICTVTAVTATTLTISAGATSWASADYYFPKHCSGHVIANGHLVREGTDNDIIVTLSGSYGVQLSNVQIDGCVQGVDVLYARIDGNVIQTRITGVNQTAIQLIKGCTGSVVRGNKLWIRNDSNTTERGGIGIAHQLRNPDEIAVEDNHVYMQVRGVAIAVESATRARVNRNRIELYTPGDSVNSGAINIRATNRDIDFVQVCDNDIRAAAGSGTWDYGVSIAANPNDIVSAVISGNSIFNATNPYAFTASGGGLFTTPPVLTDGTVGTGNSPVVPSGTAVKWFQVSGLSGPATGGTYMAGRIFWGDDTPEGALTAPVGSLAIRRNGGASTTLYVKESGTGNTGWVAK